MTLLNSDAEIDSTRDSLEDVWAKRMAIKTELAQRLWDDGFGISRSIYQLSVEDVLDVLADLTVEGKFDKDDLDIDLYDLVSAVMDGLEYIEWRAYVRNCVFDYLYGVQA
jgi:hypothetical protein